jgi:hypothetical protein
VTHSPVVLASTLSSNTYTVRAVAVPAIDAAGTYTTNDGACSRCGDKNN